MARSKTPLIVIAVLVVLFALGFRVQHPHSGFKTALGSASSSLVITRHSSTYGVGEKVIAASSSKELSPFLGSITAVNGTSYAVANGVFNESVDASKISGKMVVVIPFFGYIFGIVGL